VEAAGVGPQVRGISCAGLDVAVARWLYSLEGSLDPKTIVTYKGYAAGWLRRWGETALLTDAAISLFVQEGLRKVAATTVRKETSALRGFFRHAYGALAPTVPSVPKKVLGTRKLRYRKPDIIDRDKLLAAIDALPEWSKPRLGKRFPIRARLIVQYETGLRREAVSLIEWSDVRGNTLTIRHEVDKARFGRDIPLSKRAVQAIGTLQKASGVMFGDHDYRWAMSRLAESLGVEKVTLRGLRHNRLTHLADDGVPLTAIAYVAGHKHLSTTSLYSRGTRDVAFKALAGK